MPKELIEINSFDAGTITSVSERDIPTEAASYSLNVDPVNRDGQLKGVPEDRLVTSLSTVVPIDVLNYGLQWGASAIRVSDLSKVPVPRTDSKGSRITFKGLKGKTEVLKYNSYYFDTSQIKDTVLNIEGGLGDVPQELSESNTTISVIDLGIKRDGLITAGDVITLSSQTDVDNISSSTEWMLVTAVNREEGAIEVERGHYNTTPQHYTSLSTNTNIYRLEGLLGWLNVTGWQTAFNNNHMGQNPCLITVANAAASSAYNLTHDSANKTITITSDSLSNNLGSADSLEDLIKSGDTIKIITSSGAIVNVVVDYMSNGVINYDSISDTLSNVTSGSYWIDANKVTNGNFKAYSTSPNAPLGWTTKRTDDSSIGYDDVYAADTNSIGSPQLSTTGGVTGIKGNERGTASTEVPFVILNNYRDVTSTVNSITLVGSVTNLHPVITLSDISNISVGDTLVISNGIGLTIDNTTGDAASVVDDSPYLDNYHTSGYLYEAINVASFTDDDAFEINVPTAIGGSGVTHIIRLEDTSSDTLTAATTNTYVNVSNEDAAGSNASDAQLALNLVGAINGTINDAQQVTYGTATGIGSFGDGIEGLQASINSETATKIDLQYNIAEEYVKVQHVEVSQDAGGDATSGQIAVTRGYHGNKKAHENGASIKKVVGNKIYQTTNVNTVKPGTNYRLTWWVSDVTRAWLQDNKINLKSKLKAQIKVGNAGYVASTGEVINGEEGLLWLDSEEYTTSLDSNNTSGGGGNNLKGSCYVTLDGNKDIAGNVANNYSQASISNVEHIPYHERPHNGDVISIIQDSGTTVNGNWTVGDSSDEGYASSDGVVYQSVANNPTALIHMNAVATTNSIIGLPYNENHRYYTAWASALAGESNLNSNGSDPKRRFYLDFEDFVGVLKNGNVYFNYTKQIKFYISAADGHNAKISVADDINPQNGLIDGRYERVYNDENQLSDEVYARYAVNTSLALQRNEFIMVPKDGTNIGFFQTYPTAYPYDGSGGIPLTNADDIHTGAVLNTGTAWAKSLKLAIEAAFNNWHGDGVTRFTVTRSGSKLCIEDAIGGAIADTPGITVPSSFVNYVEGMRYSPNGMSPHAYTPGKMHFQIYFGSHRMSSNTNGSTNLNYNTDFLNSTENSGQPGHYAFFKKDGLGINLGGIVDSSGNYDSDYGANLGYVPEFTTCYHKGSDAGDTATNLDLAIEHANGHNGVISGSVANTDELTLTHSIPDALKEIESSRFFGTASIDNAFSEIEFLNSAFEFYNGTTTDYNGGAKALLWHKCSIDFTIPDYIDEDQLTISFKSDGQVWGTRTLDAIGEDTKIDKYSSLMGLCGISLTEKTRLELFDEGTTNILSSSIIKDSENKENLVYYDRNQSMLKVIKDFGDPLEGRENTILSTSFEANPHYQTKIPSFTKNNREVHIGLGPEKDTVWGGFLNYNQFGNDYSNEFVFEKGEIESYDDTSTSVVDKVVLSGEWHCSYGAYSWNECDKLTLNIPSTDHGMKVGEFVTVRKVYDTKEHENLGASSNYESEIKGASCMYVHSARDALDSDMKNPSEILEVNSDNIVVGVPLCTDVANVNFAIRVRPAYYYAISRNSRSIKRINPLSGMNNSITTSFPIQSICTSYSQSSTDVGNTGSRFYGGRIWAVESNTGTIHRINVTKESNSMLSAEVTCHSKWNTWWSSTEEDGEKVEKEKLPMDRGYISDIKETWGLKGTNNNLSNDSDTRLWVQFYPRSGDTFTTLDNFIYCANSSDIEATGTQITQLDFCNRTIPIYSTGGEFDPNNRYGKSQDEFRASIPVPPVQHNNPEDLKRNLISKKKQSSRSARSAHNTRYVWFNPHFFEHYWYNFGDTDGLSIESFSALEGPDELWKAFVQDNHDAITFFNHAENIGWNDPSPQIKMTKYGLIGLADNDFDGIIDGTGLPVASAANVNVGFVNGKDCSSHAAAVLMQTESSWIMQGSYFQGNGYGNGNSWFDDGAHSQNHYMHPEFTSNTLDMPVELFNPGTFFMITSDLWEREVADTSQASMRGGYSQNATLQNRVNNDTDNENSLFWNSKGTIAQGKLQHWSSDVSGAFDTVMLKDRMYVLKTNEKHNLTIGDSMVFARHSDKFRKSNVFGMDTLTNNNHYGMPSPVVGIVDEYHFVIGVTTGGTGKDTNKDTGGTDSGELNQLNPHWKIGATYNPHSSGNNDGNYPTTFGGRLSVREYKVEGGGLTFFSDMSGLTTSVRNHYYQDDYGQFKGTLSFNTSLLSFSHGRMLRPLGDGDISGITNFNIDNAHLNMITLPDAIPSKAARYKEESEQSKYYRPIAHANKLVMSCVEDLAKDETSIYTFEWNHIMPDKTRATFEGVEYKNADNEDGWDLDLVTTHRNWGSYRISEEDSAGDKHPHSTNDVSGHGLYRGSFRLGGTLSSTSSDASTGNMNFMIPGSIFIKPTKIYKPGNLEGLHPDEGQTSLLSNWQASGERKPPFYRKGALVDMVAVWSFQDEFSDSMTDFDNTPLETISDSYFSGHSYARKVICSYGTTGASTTTKVYDGTTASHNLIDVRHGDTYNSNARWNIDDGESNVGLFDSRVYMRTHYPLPSNPSQGHNTTVSLIKSRDAALCPVRIDNHFTSPYLGYSNSGETIHSLITPFNGPNGGVYLKIRTTAPPIGYSPTGHHGGSYLVSGLLESDDESLIDTDSILFSAGEKIKITNVGHLNINQEDTNVDYSSLAGDWVMSSEIIDENGVIEFVTEEKEDIPSNVFIIGMWGNEPLHCKVERYNTGVKSNPLIIEGMQGIALSGSFVKGEVYDYDSNNETHGNLGLRTDKCSFIINYMCLSTSGAYVSGFLEQMIGNTYTLGATDSTLKENISFLDKSYLSGWNKTSTQNESLGYLSNKNTNVGSFLQKTEGKVKLSPSSPPNTGTPNFTSNEEYSYKISYVYDGYQEGPLSSSSFKPTEIPSDTTYSDYEVSLSIVSPSKRLTSVCVYRKNNIYDLYRLVSEIETDGKWTKIEDEYSIKIKDNGSLGATFESRAGYSEVLENPFAQYGIATTSNGYHFVGDCSHPNIKDASHMIFRSLPGQFDLFNWANDFITLPSKPTALANFGGRLYAFDETNTYKINPQTLRIEDTYEGSGCVGMESLLITEFGMFYCDRHNAYLHKGSDPQVISQSIKTGGGTDISAFNISDLSWEKTAGNKSSMNPKIVFDNKRNAVLFFVEKLPDALVGFSRYYCWAFSLLRQRWDLWEVSTGDDGGGTFDKSRVLKPSSIIKTSSGKNFITQGNFIVDYLGGSESRPWQFLSKKITVGHQSQKKNWKNIRMIGNDDNVISSTGQIKGSMSIAVDGNVVESSDKTFTKTSPDSKVTIKGAYKSGRYIQFLVTKMANKLDGIGIIFRRKGVK
tara:strand:+ start:2798 stop:12904 length:10107 start_codon:yes stop_codon:yes gene_type:complete